MPLLEASADRNTELSGSIDFLIWRPKASRCLWGFWALARKLLRSFLTWELGHLKMGKGTALFGLETDINNTDRNNTTMTLPLALITATLGAAVKDPEAIVLQVAPARHPTISSDPPSNRACRPLLHDCPSHTRRRVTGGTLQQEDCMLRK